MPTSKEFISEIVDHREDMSIRLVYADWLEDQGDARGEFVRLQCAEAKPQFGFPPIPTDRERELLRIHKLQWVKRLTELGVLAEHIGFRWGFIDAIRILDARVASQLKQIRELSPLLRKIHFETAAAFRKGFHECSLSGLQQIGCNSPLATEYIEDFLGHDVLDSLVAVDFSKSVMGDDGLGVILGSQQLHRLIAMDLADCDIGSDGIEQLVAWPHLRKLKWLNLSGNHIDRTDVDKLINAEFDDLRRIELYHLELPNASKVAFRNRFRDAARSSSAE